MDVLEVAMESSLLCSVTTFMNDSTAFWLASSVADARTLPITRAGGAAAAGRRRRSA